MSKIKYLIFPILLLVSFTVTYAIFRSSTSGNSTVSIANWDIKLEANNEVIDLTESFGAGNEPSKEWCDANIDYFDGTITVYK